MNLFYARFGFSANVGQCKWGFHIAKLLNCTGNRKSPSAWNL